MFKRKKKQQEIIELSTDDIDNMQTILSVMLDYNRQHNIIGISNGQIADIIDSYASKVDDVTEWFYNDEFILYKEYPFSTRKYWFVPNKLLPRTQNCKYLKRTLHWTDWSVRIYKKIIEFSEAEATNVIFCEDLHKELEETNRHSFLFVLDILMSNGFIHRLHTNAGKVYKLIQPIVEELQYDYNLQEYQENLVNYILKTINIKIKGD